MVVDVQKRVDDLLDVDAECVVVDLSALLVPNSVVVEKEDKLMCPKVKQKLLQVQMITA
jgi:hypothetical protein